MQKNGQKIRIIILTPTLFLSISIRMQYVRNQNIKMKFTIILFIYFYLFLPSQNFTEYIHFLGKEKEKKIKNLYALSGTRKTHEGKIKVKKKIFISTENICLSINIRMWIQFEFEKGHLVYEFFSIAHFLCYNWPYYFVLQSNIYIILIYT